MFARYWYGEDVDTLEINKIASGPNNVFTVDSFADLDNKANEVREGYVY